LFNKVTVSLNHGNSHSMDSNNKKREYKPYSLFYNRLNWLPDIQNPDEKKHDEKKTKRT
jgi:hypothetical protein